MLGRGRLLLVTGAAATGEREGALASVDGLTCVEAASCEVRAAGLNAGVGMGREAVDEA